ncbi:HAUS augmin-like complex subunit 7 [Thalassophryne amazonica]|uniref:HAUS augmin-like complex subunit 7 n=1 Tax=Thalassophryne amazonica TaxID=390379 RepID=UPI0014725D76|nr:HAUS augmin-like complex subunit 7 [Thalassophryne amazonica]
MARASKAEELAQNVYFALQAALCPLVEGLHLHEADSMLQLLCAPSQHRTDILEWICRSINPNFATSNKVLRAKDPDILTKEMAMLGQDLMLCKVDDLDLIRGNVSPLRQLRFLEQLLTLVPGSVKSPESRMDEEMLLNVLCATETLPHLTQMLKPTFDPWPANINDLHKMTKSACHDGSREEAADVATLLQLTQVALEQLQSECEFLHSDTQHSAAFSPSALRVAACDLQQSMITFNHVYETDFKAYCRRDPPSFSTDADVFRRVHQLLLACNTELELLHEVSESSVSMSEEMNRIKTRPRYWSHGKKRTLPDQLEELNRRYRDFLSLLPS